MPARAQLWRYQGSQTLAAYLRRRDCLALLAREMDIPEAAVPATVVKQLLECLQVCALASPAHAPPALPCRAPI